VEPLEYSCIVPLEVLAASLATRLGVDELEWLWRELAKRTEAERREGVRSARGEPLIPATYKNAWEPMKGKASWEALGEFPSTPLVGISTNRPVLRDSSDSSGKQAAF
jgi:hypothetical protein